MLLNEFIQLLTDICTAEHIDINTVELAFFDNAHSGVVEDAIQCSVASYSGVGDSTPKNCIIISALSDDDITDEDRLNIEINEITDGKRYCKVELDDPDVFDD